MKVIGQLQFLLLSCLMSMILAACGSAPTAPKAVVAPATVATVATTFGAVTGLPNGQASVPVTVTALDANGLPVANAPVTVSINGTLAAGAAPTLVAGAVTNVSGVTGATGKATMVVSYFVAPGLSVTTTAGGIAAPAVAAPVPVVAKIVTNTTPALGVVADGYSLYTLTAFLYDAGNNLVAGENVTFGATSQQNGQVALSANTAVAGAGGSVTLTVADTSAVNDTVTVLIHALSDTYGAADARVALNFTGSGVGGNIATNGQTLKLFSIAPASAPADGVTPVVVTFEARDAYGAVVAGMPVTATSSLHGVVSPAVPVATDVYGHATFQVTDTYAEAITLLASQKGLLPVGSSTALVFNPYASNLSFTANKTLMIGDNIDVVNLSVTATGPQGAVANERIRLTSTSNTAQLGALFVTTDQYGFATTTLKNSVSERVTITAATRDGGALPGIVVSRAIDVYSAVPKPVITVAPAGPFLADGYTQGHALTVTVKNAAGVPQANQPLTFSVNPYANAGISNQPLLQGGGQQVTYWSDAAGTITVYVSDSVAEDMAFTVTAADGTVVTSPLIRFVATAPASMSLTASASTVIANTAVKYTATVRDAATRGVANAWVQFDAYSGATKIGSFGGLTDVYGAVSTSFTLSKLGTHDVYATLLYNANVASSLQTTLVAVSKPQLIIAAAGPFLADGVTTGHAVRIQVRDAYGNIAVNQPITLSMSGSAGLSTLAANQTGLTTIQATSNAVGVIDLYASDAIAELATLTAVAVDGTQATSTIRFVAANPTQVAVTVNPTNVNPDGVSAITVTATVRDVNGVAVPNAWVQFSTSNPAVIRLSSSTGLTGANGQVSATLSSAVSIPAPGATVTATLIMNGNVQGSATVTFVDVVSQVILTPVIAQAQANGVATTSVRARVININGTPLPNRLVTFAHQSSATISAASATTDAYGQCTVTLTDTIAETVNVTATSETVASTAAAVTFTPVIGSMAMTVQPFGASVPADGNAPATFVVNLKDANGLPLAGQAVQFIDDGYANYPAGYTSAAQLSAASVITDATGTAVITVVDPRVEAVTIRAIAGNKSAIGTVNFAATNVQFFSNSAQPFVANGVQDNYVYIIVRDQLGNLAPGVNMAVTGSSSTMIPSVAGAITIITDAYGNASLRVSDTVAETGVLTFTVNGGGAFSIPVTFAAATPTAMTMTVTPSSGVVAPDGVTPATINVQVKDAYGAAVSNAWVQLDAYSGAAPDAFAKLGAAKLLTGPNGVASTTLTRTKVGTTTVNASLLKNPAVPVVTANVLFDDPVTSVLLFPSVTQVRADGVASIALKARVLGGAGQRLAGRVVTFSHQSSAVVSAPAVTDVYGETTVTMTDTVAEVVAVTASVNAGTLNVVSVPSSLTFTPLVNTMTMNMLPANGGGVPADGTSTASVVVTLKDAYGSPIANSNVQFFDVYGTSARLSAASAVTDATGSATITLQDVYSEAVTVRATADNQVRTGTVNFTLTNLQFVVSGATPFLADGVGHLVTITASDQLGNPAPNQVFQIKTASVTMIPSQTQITTNAAGQATLLLRDSVAETANITFTNGATNGGLSFTLPVQFVAANVSSLSIQATPANGVNPDGATAATIKVFAKDAYGAAVANAAISVAATGLNGATVAGGNVLTDASGVAIATVSSIAAGTATITATAPRNLTPAVAPVSTTVVFETPVAAVTMAAIPASVDAYGVGATSTLTATVLDAAGKPIANRNVSFAIVSGSGALSAATATTLVDGTAQVSVYSQVAGVVQVAATAGAVTSTPLAVTFVPVVAQIRAATQPAASSVAADGASLGRVIVNVKDANGTPIAGQRVQFFDQYGSSAQFSAPSAITDVTGSASIAVTNPTPGIVTVRAVAGSHPASQKTVYAQLQFDATVFQVNVSGGFPFTADGALHPVSIQVNDAYGAPVTTPQTFTLSSNTPTTFFNVLSLTTDAYGAATFSVKNSVAELSTITLTAANGLTFSRDIQFVSSQPATFQVSASAQTLPDGVSTAAVQVVVTDLYGAIVPGAWVHFAALAGNGAVDPYAVMKAVSGGSSANFSSTGSLLTTQQGTVSIGITRTQSGTVNLQVSLPRNTGVATKTVPVVFAGQVVQAPSAIAMTSSKYTLKSDGSDSVTLTAVVKDAQNVGVSAATVTFTPTSTGDAGVLSASTAVTDAYGKAQVTLSAGTFDRSNRTINVVANVGALTPTPVVPIVVSGSTVTALATNTSLIANGTQSSQIQVTLKDSGGNAVPFVPVSGAVTVSNNAGLVVDVYSGSKLMMTGVGGNWIGDSYATTNTSGMVTFDVYAHGTVAGGTVTITPSALGASASAKFTPSLSGDVFVFLDPYKNPMQAMSLYGRRTVTVASSGAVRLAAANAFANGLKADPYAYVKISSTSGRWAATPGGALSVDPYIIVPFSTVSPYNAVVDFYANLPGVVNLQADEYINAATPATASDSVLLQVNATTPTVVSVTSSTSTVAPSVAGQQHTATITATVRDVNNFAVSNTPVTFSIINGPGGGEYMSPVTAFTDAGGNVISTFNSGSLPSAVNGITVAASVFHNGQTITGTTKMTIGQSAVSISLGTSSKLGSTTDGTSYILPMSALVTDINGAAIPGAIVTLRVRPLVYAYGYRAAIKSSVYGIGDAAYWPGYNFDTAYYSATLTTINTQNNAVAGSAIGFGTEDRNNNQIMDIVTTGAPEDGYTRLYDFHSPLAGEITDQYTAYTYFNYNAALWQQCTAKPLANQDTCVFNPAYITTDAYGAPNCKPVSAAQFANITGTLPSWYCAPMKDGALTPAHASAGSVPNTAVADAAGLASFNLTYQKQYANWLVVEVSATIQNTAGTESVGKLSFQLPISLPDLATVGTAYPVSPFGRQP